jgi:hypothetical protein
MLQFRIRSYPVGVDSHTIYIQDLRPIQLAPSFTEVRPVEQFNRASLNNVFDISWEAFLMTCSMPLRLPFKNPLLKHPPQLTDSVNPQLRFVAFEKHQFVEVFELE